MNEPRNRKSKAWKLIRRAAAVCLIALALTAGVICSYCAIIQFLGNVHVVVEHQFYRSAELNKTALQRVIREDGIKSILNLQGFSPDKSWYADEIAASQELGVAHYDYGISARSVVTPDRINEILNIIRDAPKPMLVHCKAGADRTGLISAIYLAKIRGVMVDQAASQLSLYYGHFPWLGSRTAAMDQSFEGYIKQAENLHYR